MPRISGPRVERRPPQDQAGQEPVGFTARASSAVPQWAAGVRVEAQDVAASDTGLVSGRDVVEVSLPGSRWDELGEGNAAFGLLADSGKDVVWSVPLDVQNTPLEEIAGGSYDQRWATLGRLVARPDSQVVVRPVVPADADPAQAKAAFRRAAAALQSAGVLVEWSAAPGFDMTRLPEAWPGPDVVDVVGVEIGVEAFPRQVGGPGGLADWRTWATSHRKRLAVHWDLENADPLYVQQMASWLDVAARSSVLAYDTVDATDGVDARSLRIYRGLWPQ
ncbi:MAG: hypothetical protein Q4G43_04880 [Mobilicoccus sp.]|nr:hypothetical protein [Mobilicoccus sp.]